MATVPLSGTNVRILSDVPFNNDYKNTRWFTSKVAQTNYFTAKPIVHQESEMNFQRIEGKHFISVNKSIDELWGANYLMFQNASYNNKWFYAFVTKLEYKQRNNTYVHFEIDVLQTWKFDMNFKPSYVVREHRALWNSDGTPVVNTVDEGLDYGLDYEVVSMERWLPYDDIYFLVVVMQGAVHSTNFSGSDPYDGQPLATNNGMPQPLTHYILPFRMKDGKWDQPLVSIDDSITMATSNPLEFIQRLSEMDNTVNNIASIYVTDFIGANPTLEGNKLLFNDSFEWANIIDDQYELNAICVKNLMDYQTKTKNFGNKYKGFKDVKESKLLMYPYAITILDDFKGNRVVLKNEFIDSRDLKVTVKGSMGTSNKVAYGVNDYLTGDLSKRDQLLASLEFSLINNNPNDIPIITDMLSSFLQGNRNSLENQKNSILFNGAVDLAGNTIGAVTSAAKGNPIGMVSSMTNVVKGAGNAVLQIEGIQSKIQDVGNIPPQINKMGANTAFDYGNGYDGLFVIKKQAREEYRNILSDFFNMFGYRTNLVKIPNFRTRRNWNYVQTLNCVITGNFNNEDLQELKDIFDGGITLWHTEDVGNYNLDNGVR